LSATIATFASFGETSQNLTIGTALVMRIGQRLQLKDQFSLTKSCSSRALMDFEQDDFNISRPHVLAPLRSTFWT